MNDTQFVPVMTPAHLVIDTMQFIVERSVVDSDESTELPPADAITEEQAAKVWTVEELHRFSQGHWAAVQTTVKVLDVLAAEPSRWFSTSELVELTGVPRPNLKGAWPALRRHITAHYPGHGWPHEFKWGPELGREAETHYSVTPERAAEWRQAREM